jgi:hypothetical protein
MYEASRERFHSCPFCRSTDIVRVRREGLRDHLLRLFGWRVYRCRDCSQRFYDRPLRRTR